MKEPEVYTGPTVRTDIHYFSYDTAKPADAAAYAALCEQLSATPCRGKQLRVWALNGTSYRTRAHGTVEPVELRAEHLYSNQWDTADGYRVFDWYEGIPKHPRSDDIHTGHYIDITPEIVRLRFNTLCSGWSGAQYTVDERQAMPPILRDFDVSPKSFGSEYLSEDDLHLTRLVRVADSDKPNARTELSKAEREVLLPLYIKMQTSGDVPAELLEEVTARRAKLLAEAEHELRGYAWLAERRLSVSNVIFYNHTSSFSFGWHGGFSPSVAAAWRELLEGFPVPYDIKTK